MSFRDELQTVLGDTYTIERELGGGGMSRVFVAREVVRGKSAAIERTVAIKVLKPDAIRTLDLASFQREIANAMPLTHPNIVTVLASGANAEIPYFVMEYVEGQSLESRLLDKEPLSVRDVLSILRDVSNALAYAHEHKHRLVHRDVKPGNILLSSGVALVADFGISKAYQNPQAGVSATETGFQRGTPAYMAPEQIMGSNAGPSADLYALGCVGYEMLAGRQPFDALSVNAMLVAHVNTEPPPLASLRPDAPAELVALIERCLRKRPEERPESARAVYEACSAMLATLSSENAILPPRSRVWLAAAGLTLLLIGALTNHALGRSRGLLASGTLADSAMILVTDFRASGPDSVLGRVVSEGIRDRLMRSNRVRLVQTGAVVGALERMRLPTDQEIDLPTARAMAAREGYAAIVDGELTRVDGELLVRLSIVQASSGDVLGVVHRTAKSTDELLEVIDRAGQELREKIGESIRDLRADPPLMQVMTADLEALRLYTEASRAFDRMAGGDAVTLLERAIARDSGFAMAYRKLGLILGQNLALRQRSFEVLERGFALRETMSPAERLAFEAVYHSWGPNANVPQVVRSYEELFRRYPEYIRVISPDLLAENYVIQRRYAEAESVWTVSMREVPEEASPWIDILRAYAAQGKFEAASAHLQVLRQKGWKVDVVEAHLLHAEGRRGEARTVLLNAARDGVAPRAVHTLLAFQALERGRLHEWEAHADTATRAPAAGQGNRREAFSWFGYPDVDLDRARVLARYRDNREAAAALLRAKLTQEELSPSNAGQKLRIAAIAAELGDTALAQATVAGVDSLLSFLANPALVPLARATAVAAIAFESGRPDAAAGHLRSLLDNPLLPPECTICYDLELARALAAAGQPDAAISQLRHYLATQRLQRLSSDRWDRPAVLQLLAELSEARGDVASARAALREFVELWREADPILQPRVRAAEARLAALGGAASVAGRP